MMATQVVPDHVTRSPEEISDSAEHGTVTQAPDVHEIQEQQFPVEAFPSCWHAALGTECARVLYPAMLTDECLGIMQNDRRCVVLLTAIQTQHHSAEVAVPRVLLDRFPPLRLLCYFGLLYFFHGSKV